MICTVAEFRAFDVFGKFAAVGDAQVEAELQHAEEVLFGFVNGRGYDAATILTAETANVAVHRTILKVARAELLNIVGANPADPAEALTILERDRAVAWFEKSLANGVAHLVGASAPARSQAAVAGTFALETEDEAGW
jgi:hypothetical protein